MRAVCTVAIVLAIAPVAHAQPAMQAATSPAGPSLEVVLSWPPRCRRAALQSLPPCCGAAGLSGDAAQFHADRAAERLRRHPGGHPDRVG